MNILMMTNTYTPLVGGLERSVQAFTREYRQRGHRVIVVAPEFENAPTNEEDVIRVKALQNFNGSDFSIQLPVPGALSAALGDFKPDIVHSHHPFLIGDTALRFSYKHNAPLVFTHHTLYEQNTHYVPGDSAALKRFVVELSTGYANLADQVFAPSESVERLLQERGVRTPIRVIPTGIHAEMFKAVSSDDLRRKIGLPLGAFVVGHVGRLAEEKNLGFLSRGVAEFMKSEPSARFLLVGDGPSAREINAFFRQAGLASRVHRTGVLHGDQLIAAYHAMHVFVFASQSETQGVVLAEAMAAGVPVVAVDACGVRDVVKDGINGRLLADETLSEFASALHWVNHLSKDRREALAQSALDTAEVFSMPHCAEKALEVYAGLVAHHQDESNVDESLWARARGRIQAEWDIMKNVAKATRAGIRRKDTTDEESVIE